MIYADYAASAPISSAAARAMTEYMKLCGNPSSNHAAGDLAREVISTARESVAKLLGCESGEIYFTSGGTEADNLAVFGGFELAKQRGKACIVASEIEHSAVAEPIKLLARRGAEVRYIPADERGTDGEPGGRVSISALERALGGDVGLLALMYANNETGVLQPVREAAELARSAGAIVFSDAVAAAGHTPISAVELGVDMLSLSGHKLGAPAGIGALYVRHGISLPPMLLGGGQERGLRSGTEPVALIAALGEACRVALLSMHVMTGVATMRDKLARALVSVSGARVNGDTAVALPGTLNISFSGVNGEALVNLCSLRGVCISTGSACHSGESAPSGVLLSMGLSNERAAEAVRVSIGRETAEAEVARIAEVISECVRLIRNA